MIPFRLGPMRSTPSILIEPRSGRSKPAMMFSKVDLPQPEGPTIATNSPSRDVEAHVVDDRQRAEVLADAVDDDLAYRT